MVDDKVFVVTSEDTGYVVGVFSSNKRAKLARDSYKAWCKRMFQPHREYNVRVTSHIVDTRE